jgi:hypothetical protein
MKISKALRRFAAFAAAALILVSAIPLAVFAEEETFVFEELRDYLVQDTYVANDGKIGIPMSVCTYAKIDPKETDSNTTVLIYVLGYNGERIGTEKDIDILSDLLDEGYVVITMDYLDDPKATVPEIIWSVQNTRMNPGKYLPGFKFASKGVMVLPSGYRILRDVHFFKLDENGYKGTYEYIVDVWNGEKFQTAKGSRIPEGHEFAKSIEDCVKPDGSPIEFDLRLDIVYPSLPKRETEVLLLASSSETRFSANAVRPLDIGALFNGYTFACYEHSYIPMSRNDHYGYFLPYSVMQWVGNAVHSTAIRCVRYYADTFGYSRDNYGVWGHSKSSQCAVLSTPHPETLPEWNNFRSYGYEPREAYGEMRFITYDDGEAIPSNVQTAYHSMGDGSKSYKKWLSDDCCPTIICCGIKDQYGSWDYWAAENEAYANSAVEYLSISMFNDGHNYPNGIDTVYKYDRFNAMMDFFNYHLKGKGNKLVYTSAVDGRLVTHDEVGTVLDGNELIMQFIASIDPDSAKENIRLYEKGGAEVQGSILFNTDNKLTFVPSAALVKGKEYRLEISGDLLDTRGGKLDETAVITFKY